MERVKGIEPSSQAWEAHILPLDHTRIFLPSLSPFLILGMNRPLFCTVGSNIPRNLRIRTSVSSALQKIGASEGNRTLV